MSDAGLVRVDSANGRKYYGLAKPKIIINNWVPNRLIAILFVIVII